jgi:hypothetical protein
MIAKREIGSNHDPGSSVTMDGVAAPALVCLALLIAAIVSVAPATAAAYASLGMPVNLRGLSIEGVRATVAEPTAGHSELLVTGEIVNLRQAETSVPNLRIALLGADRRDLYLWTAREPKSRLGPHERVAFRARLAAPPVGVRDVLVKFAGPGDKASFTE